MWFIGVEVEQETSALPPKKNPGSAPDSYLAQASLFPTLYHFILAGNITKIFATRK